MQVEMVIRKAQRSDAKQIYNLVKKTKILDVNSEYLYLLQVTHFRETCCVLEVDNEIVGFVTGYICPQNRDIFFVWQVGVDDKVRGKNMAGKMISYLLGTEALQGIKYIHTTISPSNKASQRVFRKLANKLNTAITEETMFEARDFNHAHEEEVLYKIGPL